MGRARHKPIRLVDHLRGFPNTSLARLPLPAPARLGHTGAVNDTLTAFAQAKIAGLEAKSLARTLKPTHRLDGVRVIRGGREMISFSCNDYLGLSHHPAVKAAAIAAVETYGTGAGASRLVTGDHPLFEVLEARLAALKGAEACCIFGSGYLANVGIIPTCVGPGDLILVDELAHSCIWAGARLSGAQVVAFRHNDAADLMAGLAAHRSGARRALIATEGVFSMDGDVAPLDAISRLAQAHDAWLMVDDAHGLGVLGGGAGTAAMFPGARIDLNMGTLSKSVGGYGAYVCATAPVIALIKMRARTVVYTTGLPPANVAAAIAALDIIAAEPDRVAAPLTKARRFTTALNLPAAESAIVPIVLGEAGTALAAAADLEAKGLLAVPIRPPTVPEGTARLRIAFTAAHPDEAVDRLAEAVRPWLAR
jgi:8-amino-7-oxononanoate synthase